MEYFKVLGIHPPRLSILAKELEKAFYKASFASHPDLKSANEQVAATSEAAHVNVAYKTLKDVWSRAQYVVGKDPADDRMKVLPAFAELYFELQELEDPQLLRDFEKRLKDEQHRRQERLQTLFLKWDQNPDEREMITRQLKELVRENTYANSMRRDVEAKLLKMSAASHEKETRS